MVRTYKVQVQVPVAAFGGMRLVTHTIRGIKATEPMLAAEKAERIAWNLYGGQLDRYFAFKVEKDEADPPDLEWSRDVTAEVLG